MKGSTPVFILIFSLVVICSTNIFPQKISALVYERAYTGFLQSPAPGEDDNTLILWKRPVEEGRRMDGTKITMADALLDSLGSLGDLQGKKITLSGTFQRFPNGLIFCLKAELINHGDLAREAEMAEKLSLLIEGHIELGPNSLLVYKNSVGEDFLEEIRFDKYTLFVGVTPLDRLKILPKNQKLRIKVGWRPDTEISSFGQPPSDYTADYINVTVLK